MIGILAAMTVEAQLLREQLKNETTRTAAGREFWCGELCGVPVTLAVAGIGKVNAATCTQVMIDVFGAEAVINTGIAGGAKEGVRHGDIVVADSLVYHDFTPGILDHVFPYTEVFKTDEGLSDLAAEACGSCHRGLIATGDQFISDSEVKADIVRRFAPCCVDMESAAVGHTCMASGVKCTIVRAISDMADDNAEESYELFEQKAAARAAEMIMRMLGKMKG